MSAIFGIVNLDGSPVPSAHLEAMKHAMASWGPDGATTWSEGPVGLGQLLMYNTPESLNESLPLSNAGGDVVLTAAARIDNRQDLFRQLDLPPSERVGLPDSALILRAYEKWGTGCVSRLLGDWSVALWDARRRQLFLARDHFGVTGLYFYQGDRTFVFASCRSGLFSLDDVPRRLNRLRVPGDDLPSQDGSHGHYEAIGRLTVAQAMTVATTGTKSWTYWTPEDAPEIRLGSDREYLEAFMEIYTEAVRCRLRSHRPVATMLSGGLDSGSIATLAAQALAERGDRLSAFTAVPMYDVAQATPRGRSGNESKNAQAICDFAGNIDLTFIRGVTRTPVEAIKEAQRVLLSPHGIAIIVWYLELLETAQAQGFGAILDGWGGNLTVSWTGNRQRYLASLLRDRRWREYAREINAKRGVHPSPLWRTAADAVTPLIGPSLTELARRAARRDLVGRDSRRLLGKHTGSPPTHPEVTKARNPELQHFFRFGSGLNSTLDSFGAAFDLEIRIPAMDKRVIEFCQGIPLDQFCRDGRDRLLVKRAMSGLMPDGVVWDNKRGLQAADSSHRVRADATETAKTLTALEESHLVRQYVDLPRLRHTFEKICSSPEADTRHDTSMLLRGIGYAMFLQTFDDE
ncbi:MAG: hypothetical protein HKN91_11265 [Acidimicrobiia bacterium]|nr:hypothetical protein [Acidimicrobiia bacterium]